jgi:hypothetical protein
MPRVNQHSRWRIRCGTAIMLQDPPDRRSADTMAELEQLALQPDIPPARVLPRRPHHQGDQDILDRRPPGPVRGGPSSTHEVAMPTQGLVAGTVSRCCWRDRGAGNLAGGGGPVHPIGGRRLPISGGDPGEEEM